MSKQPKYRRTKRIYFGPPGNERSGWWDVEVSPAKKPVSVNGSVLNALKAFQGVTVGCALSNVALSCKDAFGHDVFLVSVTKSMLLAVDKLNRQGQPCHAIQYAHSYHHITDRNDNGTLKKMVKDDPTIIERSFNLRVPRDPRKPEGKSAHSTANLGKTDRTRAFVHRGALQRAVKAGLIGDHVAAQITDRTDKHPASYEVA